jgi:hypothetical protein
MKSVFFKINFVLLFLFLFQNQLLIGKEQTQCEQVRYYVAAENVGICEDGILILGGESLILVKCLLHDEQGFYFLDTDGCGWVCNWCGTINPLGASRCKRCNEPYGSRPPKKNR